MHCLEVIVHRNVMQVLKEAREAISPYRLEAIEDANPDIFTPEWDEGGEG